MSIWKSFIFVSICVRMGKKRLADWRSIQSKGMIVSLIWLMNGLLVVEKTKSGMSV